MLKKSPSGLLLLYFIVFCGDMKSASENSISSSFSKPSKREYYSRKRLFKGGMPGKENANPHVVGEQKISPKSTALTVIQRKSTSYSRASDVFEMSSVVSPHHNHIGRTRSTIVVSQKEFLDRLIDTVANVSVNGAIYSQKVGLFKSAVEARNSDGGEALARTNTTPMTKRASTPFDNCKRAFATVVQASSLVNDAVKREVVKRIMPEGIISDDGNPVPYRAILRQTNKTPSFFTFSPHHIAKSEQRARDKEARKRAALNGTGTENMQSVAGLEEQEKQLKSRIGVIEEEMKRFQQEENSERA